MFTLNILDPDIILKNVYTDKVELGKFHKTNTSMYFIDDCAGFENGGNDTLTGFEVEYLAEKNELRICGVPSIIVDKYKYDGNVRKRLGDVSWKYKRRYEIRDAYEAFYGFFELLKSDGQQYVEVQPDILPFIVYILENCKGGVVIKDDTFSLNLLDFFQIRGKVSAGYCKNVFLFSDIGLYDKHSNKNFFDLEEVSLCNLDYRYYDHTLEYILKSLEENEIIRYINLSILKTTFIQSNM
ncbi:hypothetical protein [Alkaliphilus sp. B6464]|uniref:hypothetical protein n=1 Tax=Alkaliphilus sp. B6464 TaxID=2731219 RepID=UPI001BA7A21B|nr:hypothetical protein [Alkaliphilus sp. B6464]QUH21889.1 hypothetical protein HYG84_18305 [Alkaliphilus sp. B6464]